jgi:hypothetical protein
MAVRLSALGKYMRDYFHKGIKRPERDVLVWNVSASPSTISLRDVQDKGQRLPSALAADKYSSRCYTHGVLDVSE